MTGLPRTWSDIRRAPWSSGTSRPQAAPSGLGAPSMAVVVRAVALEAGVPADDLLGDARDRRTAAARMTAMARCARQGRSLSAVARYFGRHHTTVLHAVRRCGGEAAS